MSAVQISCLATVCPFAKRVLCNAYLVRERKFQFWFLALDELRT